MRGDLGFRTDPDGVPHWTPGAHIADLQKSDGFDLVVGSDGVVDRPGPDESLLNVIDRNREE